MYINSLQRNKKSRNSLIIKRKIVEAYRAELVTTDQLRRHLHLPMGKLRQLNRWYFKHRIQRYLNSPLIPPKGMKNNATYLKELERRLQQAEQENKMLRLKAEAYETVIQIAEEQFNIPILKKSGRAADRVRQPKR